MSHLMFCCNLNSACYFLTTQQPNSQPELPVWLMVVADFFQHSSTQHASVCYFRQNTRRTMASNGFTMSSTVVKRHKTKSTRYMCPKSHQPLSHSSDSHPRTYYCAQHPNGFFLPWDPFVLFVELYFSYDRWVGLLCGYAIE